MPITGKIAVNEYPGTMKMAVLRSISTSSKVNALQTTTTMRCCRIVLPNAKGPPLAYPSPTYTHIYVYTYSVWLRWYLSHNIHIVFVYIVPGGILCKAAAKGNRNYYHICEKRFDGLVFRPNLRLISEIIGFCNYLSIRVRCLDWVSWMNFSNNKWTNN